MRFISALALSAALSVSVFAGLPKYHVVDLGVLPGHDSSGAFGINNHGVAVGYSQIDSTFQSTGTLFGHGGPVALSPAPGHPQSIANHVNESHLIVGWSGDDTTIHAAVWAGGIPTLLQEPPGTEQSNAVASNIFHQVAGSAFSASWVGPQAVVWWNEKPYYTGNLYGKNAGFAYDINKVGRVVGESYNVNSPNLDSRPFYWVNHRLFQLGLPKWALAAAGFAINDENTVVGPVLLKDFSLKGILWYWGYMFLLPTLPGYDGGYPNDISNNNEIVGFSINPDSGESRGTYWVGDHPYDLNKLIDEASKEWTVTAALAVNDRGQIVGIGINGTGTSHAIRLDRVVPPF